MPEAAGFRENIRRVSALLGEFGWPVESGAEGAGDWIARFTAYGAALQAQVSEGRAFVEFSAFFVFDGAFADFLSDRVDEFQRIAYHYGCYQLTEAADRKITISVHTKLYFSGLQYYALKEAVGDLAAAAHELRVLFEPDHGPVGR
jgi:hypothetical protein